MDWILDGRTCSSLPLDGNPTRAVYFYKSTEGDGPVEVRITNSLVPVPEDNGASWTGANHPTGAHLWLRVPDETPEREVADRLIAAYHNKERAYKEMLAANQGVDVSEVETHGEGTYDPSTPFAKPPEEADTQSLETWQILGFESKAAWKAAGKPKA